MSNEDLETSGHEDSAREIQEFEFNPEEYADVEEILEDDALEPESGEQDVEGASIADTVEGQNSEAEKVAVAFLKKVLRLRGVRIDREQFLRAELKQRWVSDADIERAIAADTVAAGISANLLDDIAESAIRFETGKASVFSAAMGLGGPAVMAVGLPADLMQYYVHAFRVMQKLAYTYGWTSFFDEAEEVTDEVLAQFVVFLGVMLGVGGAANGVKAFAQAAAPAVQKNIAKKALTKTSWYPVLKKTLRVVGVKITRDSVGKAVGKALPIVGGVVSGSMTFVALRSQAKRLRTTLREIPAPGGVRSQSRTSALT